MSFRERAHNVVQRPKASRVVFGMCMLALGGGVEVLAREPMFADMYFAIGTLAVASGFVRRSPDGAASDAVTAAPEQHAGDDTAPSGADLAAVSNNTSN